MLITKHFAFVHVPKTGGIWFREIVRKHAPDEWLPMIDSRAKGEQHATAVEVRRRTHLPIVAVVRNPWDWWVSWFFFMKRHGKQHTAWQLAFADVGENVKGFRLALPRMARGCPQGRIVFDDQGELRADGLVRFDQLRIAMPAQLHTLGVPSVDHLPWESFPRQNRSEHGPYEDYYTQELADLVRECSRDLIHVAGFSFGS